MLAGSWLSDMDTCPILKKLVTPPKHDRPKITTQSQNMTAQKNTLLTPSLPVFSAQSREELQRAVYDCCRDGISSEDNRPTRLHGPIGKWDVSQVTDMSKITKHLVHVGHLRHIPFANRAVEPRGAIIV